jgi:hypothetical protein
MKTILFTILFALFSFSHFAQSYIKFPIDNASWESLERYAEPQNKAGSYCFEIEIKAAGDTLIQGQRYTILNEYSITKDAFTPMAGLIFHCTIPTDTTSRFFGLLREDTIQQRVYFKNNVAEYLMYDFSLQVGDTLRPYIMSRKYQLLQAQGLVVDSIYTDFIAGKQRRVFEFSRGVQWSSFSRFVEGIGSTAGLFRFDVGYFSGSSGNVRSELYCFSEQGVGSYSPNGQPCQMITELEEEKKSESELAVYPNPTKGQLKIQASSKIVAIQVLNNLGQMVQSFQPNANNFNWQLPEKAGLYVVRVLNEDGRQEVRKVIKVEE